MQPSSFTGGKVEFFSPALNQPLWKSKWLASLIWQEFSKTAKENTIWCFLSAETWAVLKFCLWFSISASGFLTAPLVWPITSPWPWTLTKFFPLGTLLNCTSLAFSLVFLSLVAQMVKNSPAMQETQVWSLGQEDLLEKEWVPTPVFSPGEFHGQKNVVGYRLWGRKESDMIERLTLAFWPFHRLSWTWFTVFLPDSVMPPATLPPSPKWGKVLQETERLWSWKKERESSE